MIALAMWLGLFVILLAFPADKVTGKWFMVFFVAFWTYAIATSFVTAIALLSIIR